MNIMDLSHSLNEEMPVYPGTEKPLFHKGNTIDEHGFAEKKITMFSHTGTHMDAPSHLIDGGPGLDDFPVEKFTGRACVLDMSGKEEGFIEIEDLYTVESQLEHCEFLLIRTGWDRFWGGDKYFSGFPVLSATAALWLSKVPLCGVGVDAISVDPVETTDFINHKTLMRKKHIIIENLTNLDRLPPYGFTFSAFPLKIAGADGSPVRAVAQWSDL